MQQSPTPKYWESKWTTEGDADSVREFRVLFEELVSTTGRNLANRRREKRITREALADLVGISAKALEHIERGESAGSLDLLFACSLHVGSSIDRIVCRRQCHSDVLEYDAYVQFTSLVQQAIDEGRVSEADVKAVEFAWKKRDKVPCPQTRGVPGALRLAQLAGIDLLPFLPDTFPAAELADADEHNRRHDAAMAAMHAAAAAKRKKQTVKTK